MKPVVIFREGDSILVGKNSVPFHKAVDKLRSGNYTCYLTMDIEPRIIMSYMDESDTCFGGPGRTSSFKFGSTKILYTDSWMVEDTDYKSAVEGIKAVAEPIEQAGFKLYASAATTAMMHIHKNYMKGISGLPPQFHSMATGALHAGPMIHVMGGCEYGVHIDRKSAFLKALSKPLPGKSDWTEIHTDEVEDFDCPELAIIIHATVNVPLTEKTWNMPPLPVRNASGMTIYPVGKIRGIWTLEAVKQALAMGCEIVEVHNAIATERTPWLSPYVGEINELPKKSRKSMYTRVWGKMCSQGGWIGKRVNLKAYMQSSEHTRYSVFETGAVQWSYEGTDWKDYSVNPWFRPDISAFIVSDNHCEMVESISMLEAGKFIGAHVDCIWTSDLPNARKVYLKGGWDMKGKGEIRKWGQGRYRVKNGNSVYYGKSGYRGPKIEGIDKGFEAFAESDSGGAKARAWDDEKWVSHPPSSAGIIQQTVNSPLPDATDLWGLGGYLRHEIRSKLDIAEWQTLS